MDGGNGINVNVNATDEQANGINSSVSGGVKTPFSMVIRDDTLVGTTYMMLAGDKAVDSREDLVKCIETDTNNLKEITKEFAIVDENVIKSSEG